MKAVVMAGGRGLRLRPVTNRYPKPMIPFINQPVLAHILHLLKLHNFLDVIITVQYRADQIQDHFGDGSPLGMTIHYAVEETPLGTAGSVKNAQPHLDDEPLLVVSGDIITDIDLSELVNFHQRRQAVATLALIQGADPQGYGVAVTDSEERIRQYLEKPGHAQLISNKINAGIYILEPTILDQLEPNVAYDFSYDLIPRLLSQGRPVFGHPTPDYWCDIGTIPHYLEATVDALAGRIRHIDRGHNIAGDVWAGQDVEIAPDAVLQGPIYLGDGVKINSGDVICGPAAIYPHMAIGNWALIEQPVADQHDVTSKSLHTQGVIAPC